MIVVEGIGRRRGKKGFNELVLEIENRWVVGSWLDKKGLGRGLLMDFGWKNLRKYRYFLFNGKNLF